MLKTGATVFKRFEHLPRRALSMNKKVLYLAGLLWASLSFAGESSFNDLPVSADQNIQKLLEGYEEKSRRKLPYFRGQFRSRENRTFYVVTRLYQGEFYEQVFVKVTAININTFTGVIASDPLGKVSFKSGDPISVHSSDVVDWLIVREDGTELGNLQGKALDLYQVGQAVFISKMTPKNGEFVDFEVVSVLNPYTKQEILDIVPKDIKQKVSDYLAKSMYGASSADGKEKFTYILLRFPGWDIIENEN
jgi:uncharacterized protein YegJ (DUF2314 family)